MKTLGIVGGGAWGTALAATATRAGRDVLIWAREAAVVESINTSRENATFLPGITLGEGVRATGDLAALARVDAALLVVPAQYLRPVARDLGRHLAKSVPLVIATKGVELGTAATMDEVLETEIPANPRAVLSGPTFAIEVAKGLPTAVTLASRDQALGRRLVEALGTANFRPYLSDDPVGCEIGGAVKNVLAIACGIVTGRGYGDNARAAIITRGLAEMVRLAVAKGGKAETLMGLSGLGDLTLTCTAMQSRNCSLGAALGRGERLEDVLGARNSVAEGVAGAASVALLAGRLGVEMPIVAAVDGILHRGASIDEAVRALLARPFRTES